MAIAPLRSAPGRRVVWKGAPARLWAWLTDTGYRPERHYMRGGRTPAAGARP